MISVGFSLRDRLGKNEFELYREQFVFRSFDSNDLSTSIEILQADLCADNVRARSEEGRAPRKMN